MSQKGDLENTQWSSCWRVSPASLCALNCSGCAMCVLVGSSCVTKYRGLGGLTLGTYLLIVLEPTSLWSRCWKIPGLGTAPSHRVIAWPFLSVCGENVSGSEQFPVSLPLEKNISPIGSGPTLMTSLSIYQLLIGPFSKYSHSEDCNIGIWVEARTTQPLATWFLFPFHDSSWKWALLLFF